MKRPSRAVSRIALAVLAVTVVSANGCRAWQPAPGATAGEDLYRKNCVTCHGVNGAGADGPSLITREHSPEEIAAKVRSGGEAMRSYEGTLTPEQIQLVSDYAATLSRPRS